MNPCPRCGGTQVDPEHEGRCGECRDDTIPGLNPPPDDDTLTELAPPIPSYPEPIDLDELDGEILIEELDE